jgi:mannitol-specific phosphotransferase system IIBC component
MTNIEGSSIHKLIVACDAGMGSSVMLASTLRKQLAKSGVTVEHSPVSNIPADADIIVTHAGLAERARGIAPGVPVVPFQLFLGDPAVTALVKAITSGGLINVG